LTSLGDESRAAALFDECLAVTGAIGEYWIRSMALWAMGVQSCLDGDTARATAAEQQSIRLRLPLDSRYLVGLNLDVLAWAAATDGDGVRAARLLGAAQAIMQAAGTSLVSGGPTSALHDQYEASARRALGETAFDRAFQQGLGLGFDDAVAYALGDTDQPAGRSSPTKREAAAPGSLTRREREIAELITQGLSNKEIARSLVISQRTAEGHVEHILAKLGFTARSQVAAWVAEQRATPGHG
jgi:non-specific serine/threonine protein kinase